MHLIPVHIVTILALAYSASARGYGPGMINTFGGTGLPGAPGGIGNLGARGIGVPGVAGGIGNLGARGIGVPGVAGGIGNLGARGIGVPGAPGGIGNLGAGVAGGRLSGGSVGSFAGGMSRQSGSAYGVDTSPKPYGVNYEAPDGQGGGQFKTEFGDGSGAVQGRYGYFDAQGLYRIVEYFADQNGFSATVRTNEPGVDGKENPANVAMIVENTPPGIQEAYTPASANRGIAGIGFGGMSGIPGRAGASGGVYPGGQAGGLFGGRTGISQTGFGSGSYAGFPGFQAGTSAAPGFPGGVLGVPGGTFGGSSSGAFAGIPRSSTGKSIY